MTHRLWVCKFLFYCTLHLSYMKPVLLLILLLLHAALPAQDAANIIPVPAVIVTNKGNMPINRKTLVVFQNRSLKNVAEYFNAYLEKYYGYSLPLADAATDAIAIRLEIANLPTDNPEGYRLSVSSKGITIKGNTEAGVFYGIQTLIQLLPADSVSTPVIPYMEVNDRPRFRYRGMHLDVARHMAPVSYIRQFIDYMALHKLNVLHWHLTDDQGWRIQIRKYPKLTETGAWRNGSIRGRYPGNGNDNSRYGGYYTQDEIREVVAYAAARHITVVPEIELPGHSSAAIAAYPGLSCFPAEKTVIPEKMVSAATRNVQSYGAVKIVQETWGVFDDIMCPSAYTFHFLYDVFDEVTALFPSPYIHIGADECPLDSWKRSESCKQIIKENNLKDEHALMGYFIGKIRNYLNSKGRRIIGWDEVLDANPPADAVVMSWRGEAGGLNAARAGHDVIMTPNNPLYFDHTQSMNEDSVTFGGYNPIENVYNYEPVPTGLDEKAAKHILGAQANVWTEYITNPYKIEYMVFPRMAALSEILWSPREKRNLADFEKRLPFQFARYAFMGVNYSRAYYDLSMAVYQADNSSGIVWKLASKFADATIKYEVPGISGEKEYHDPVEISLPGKYTAKMIWDNRIAGTVSQQFHMNKATGKKITMVTQPSSFYPGDGAFTLVNGIQNTMGMARSREFIGFSGADLDVTVDLGSETLVSKVNLHSLHLPGSWIYLPELIELSFKHAVDSPVVTRHQPQELFTHKVTDENNTQAIILPKPISCRYIRLFAKNKGIIPAGNPGSGHPAWLFADEIEIY